MPSFDCPDCCAPIATVYRLVDCDEELDDIYVDDDSVTFGPSMTSTTLQALVDSAKVVKTNQDNACRKVLVCDPDGSLGNDSGSSSSSSSETNEPKCSPISSVTLTDEYSDCNACFGCDGPPSLCGVCCHSESSYLKVIWFDLHVVAHFSGCTPEAFTPTPSNFPTRANGGNAMKLTWESANRWRTDNEINIEVREEGFGVGCSDPWVFSSSTYFWVRYRCSTDKWQYATGTSTTPGAWADFSESVHNLSCTDYWTADTYNCCGMSILLTDGCYDCPSQPFGWDGRVCGDKEQSIVVKHNGCCNDVGTCIEGAEDCDTGNCSEFGL